MGRKKDFNEYKIVDDYAIMYFTNRKGDVFEGYIDLDTLQELISLNWIWNAKWHRNIKGYYAIHTEYMGTTNGIPHYKTRYLHNLIMPLEKGLFPDHKNRNGLDNRKDNLRPATYSENSKNRKTNSNNKTGCANLIKSGLQWIIQLSINGRTTKVGMSYDYEEAKKLADELRQKYYGEFAPA